MIQKSYKVIGVMSGTSIDGIDLAYIEFYKNDSWSFRIIKAVTINYNSDWRHRLKNAIHLEEQELSKLDDEYSLFLANKIQSFITNNEINKVDAVCSHGHTVYHRPENGITYQIGNRRILADTLGRTIVCDFRVQDVELGGQGAPLVPIGDQLLFGEYDYCLNLGGFANISTQIRGERIAYDICPVNIVLNNYVSELGVAYDDKGEIAATGKVNDELLNDLNNLSFYRQTYPKSLGLEWVKKEVFPLIDSKNIDVNDVLRTFIEHIVCQLIKNVKGNNNVLISGGGVYNTFLIDRLKEQSKIKWEIPGVDIIDFKEALIFGFLGILKLEGEVNCLSSVTGASRDHSSGKVYRV